MRKLRILGAVGLVSMALAVLVGSPAQAHDTRAYHGNDYAEVILSHNWILACDNESDGHGVRAHWRTVTGQLGVGSWDTDGAGGSCAPNQIPTSAIEFRICENDVGCSDWKFE